MQSSSKTESLQMELLDELYLVRHFRHQVYNVLPLVAYASTGKSSTKSPPRVRMSVAQLVHDACAAADAAKLRSSELDHAVKNYLTGVRESFARSLKGGRMSRRKKSPSETVIDLATTRRLEQICADLLRIPKSFEKAKTALKHSIERGHDLSSPPDAIFTFGSEARLLFPDSVRNRRDQLLNGALPGCRNWEGSYWYGSFMRYYELFEPIEGRSAILDYCEDVDSEIREKSAAVGSDSAYASHQAYEVPLFLDRMWAHSRCRTLRHALFPLARKTLPRILQFQGTDGAWQDFKRERTNRAGNPELFSDPRTTASAIVFLTTYGVHEETDLAVNRAARWLLRAQAKDGFWRSPTSPSVRPLEITILVLDALRKAGIPADHPRIQAGEAALLEQQEPTGYWSENPGLRDEYLTCLAVEYSSVREDRGAVLNHYLRSARALLLKGEQLILSPDRTDASLAVTVSYHGLEHFLYGCMLALDSDEKIFSDNRGTTIGFNEALGAVERTLKERGTLKPNSGLPFRTQLKHLSTRRDGFIHRAEPISANEAVDLLSNVRRFVETFDLPLLRTRLCG